MLLSSRESSSCLRQAAGPDKVAGTGHPVPQALLSERAGQCPADSSSLGLPLRGSSWTPGEFARSHPPWQALDFQFSSPGSEHLLKALPRSRPLSPHVWTGSWLKSRTITGSLLWAPLCLNLWDPQTQFFSTWIAFLVFKEKLTSKYPPS